MCPAESAAERAEERRGGTAGTTTGAGRGRHRDGWWLVAAGMLGAGTVLLLALGGGVPWYGAVAAGVLVAAWVWSAGQARRDQGRVHWPSPSVDDSPLDWRPWAIGLVNAFWMTAFFAIRFLTDWAYARTANGRNPAVAGAAVASEPGWGFVVSLGILIASLAWTCFALGLAAAGQQAGREEKRG